MLSHTPMSRTLSPLAQGGPPRTNTSKVRACIEHIFAKQKSRMVLFVRTIGLARARLKIGLANLTYNLKRLVFLERQAGLLTG